MGEPTSQFRSSIDHEYTQMLNTGKIGKPPLQVIYAPYSNLYYYLDENTKYDSSQGEDVSNILIMRMGVIPKEGKLTLLDGYNRSTSVIFYKSSRHSQAMADFFRNSEQGKKDTITIYDKPNRPKDSGYITLNLNCGIDLPQELELLEGLKDVKSGHILDYLIIESGVQPTNKGLKTIKESKQTMLFGEDIANFKKWLSDIALFEERLNNKTKKASSFSVFIKNCTDVLEQKGVEGEAIDISDIDEEEPKQKRMKKSAIIREDTTSPEYERNSDDDQHNMDEVEIDDQESNGESGEGESEEESEEILS